MTIHYAPDELDATKTACNVTVGYVLTETEDEGHGHAPGRNLHGLQGLSSVR